LGCWVVCCKGLQIERLLGFMLQYLLVVICGFEHKL